MVCDVCGLEKSLSDFPKLKDTTRCLLCRKRHYDRRNRELRKESRYERNRIYNKTHYRFTRYGITREQYEALVESQGFKCAICKDPLEQETHIDHDHKCCAGRRACGKCIRGVTCKGCNKGLGMFKDNSAILRAAALYLDQA